MGSASAGSASHRRLSVDCWLVARLRLVVDVDGAPCAQEPQVIAACVDHILKSHGLQVLRLTNDPDLPIDPLRNAQ